MWNQERSLKTAKVGDRLTVLHRGDAGSYEFRTVAKVTKTSLTDDRGDRWGLSSGDRWGTAGERFNTGASVRMYRDGDMADRADARRQAQLRARRRRLAEYALWRGMPDDVIDKVQAIVDEARAQTTKAEQ